MVAFVFCGRAECVFSNEHVRAVFDDAGCPAVNPSVGGCKMAVTLRDAFDRVTFFKEYLTD